jgi:hypothetical protein
LLKVKKLWYDKIHMKIRKFYSLKAKGHRISLASSAIATNYKVDREASLPGREPIEKIAEEQ